MRFYLFGPRFLGIRTGFSFQPNDLRLRNPPKLAAANYIYVVKGVSPYSRQNVKIGITTNPETRLTQLQTGSSRKLDYAFIAPVSGNPNAIEREAHAILARYRLEGEWFDVPPELAIAAVTGAAAKLGISLSPPPAIDEEVPTWKKFAFLCFLAQVAVIIWIYIKFVSFLIWPNSN